MDFRGRYKGAPDPGGCYCPHTTMVILHLVLFRFKPDTNPIAKQEVSNKVSLIESTTK